MLNLTPDQVEKIKALHKSAQEKLTSALENGPDALCYVRGAMFDQTALLHEINLAEGTAK